MVDGYARCLLCKVDLSIAGRGLSSLWEHWRGLGHTRLEQKYRIMMQMPLLDKACRPVTAEEDRRIRQERMTEPPVYLESELSLSVDERVAIEEAEASAGERPTLPTESAAYLWLGQFISSFCNVASFGSVMRMVESWRDGMSAELRVECRSLLDLCPMSGTCIHLLFLGFSTECVFAGFGCEKGGFLNALI